MRKRSINIERLEIRLKGIKPETARDATHELGQDILGQLAAERKTSGPQRAVNIGRVDAGTVRHAGAGGSAELRSLIAGKIAASIKSKMK